MIQLFDWFRAQPSPKSPSELSAHARAFRRLSTMLTCDWVLATRSRSPSCDVFIQPYRAKFRRARRILPPKVPILLRANTNYFYRNLFSSGEDSLKSSDGYRLADCAERGLVGSSRCRT